MRRDVIQLDSRKVFLLRKAILAVNKIFVKV